ncbi:MAG: hypothetical protein K1X72_04425 [Pyrinomonadaceae bacterium]|nr:hypothetical protein [Pyrinomonadaceae bacterium]
MKNDKLEKLKDDAGQSAVSALASADAQQRRDNANRLIGGIMVTHSLSEKLASETIKGIQLIRDEQIYKSLGYSDFVTCLNELHDQGLITFNYKRFNEREVLLKEHGVAVYNLLESVDIKISRRKLLTAGQVQVEGEKVIIVSEKDGEPITEEIPVSDRKRLIASLSTLADKNLVLEQKNINLSIKSKQDQDQIKRLKKDLEEAKSRPGEKSVEAIEFEAYQRATAAIDAWAEIVKSFKPEQKDKFSDLFLKSLANSVFRVQSAYDRKLFSFKAASKSVMEMSAKEREKYLAEKLKDVGEENDFAELAELSNKLNEEALADSFNK